MRRKPVFFTQPTVSAQIRTLEEHFGVQLFERIGKKLYITNAGKSLIDPFEKTLKIIFKELSNLEIRLSTITRKDKYLSNTVHTLLKIFQENKVTI